MATSPQFNALTPNNYTTNQRAIADQGYSVNVALPNAANTVDTGNINLLVVKPFSTTETIDVAVTTTLATGANSLNINVVLQHSPANSDGTANSAGWANIPQLAAPFLVIAGNASKYPPVTLSNGNARVKLPPNVQQFIRAQATGEANGGNSSDGTLTLQLLF